MIIPHLLFAHLLGDYPLQSHWLVKRKAESWRGLLVHGGIVGFMSLVALAPYLGDVWIALVALTMLHTIQDYGKVQLGARQVVHPFVPYIGDQVLHYLTIIGIQLWIGDSLAPEPGETEIALMWTGAAVVAVTRFYDVTVWANWLDLIPYMRRWRALGYTERLSMLALAAAGAWYLAPLVALPRLVLARHEDRPIGANRRYALEMVTGAVFSIALGLGLHAVYTGI